MAAPANRGLSPIISAEREAYLSILKAGGSEHPHPLLQRAGIDMAQPEVYRAVIRRCNALMDRIETLLAEHPDLEPTTAAAASRAPNGIGLMNAGA